LRRHTFSDVFFDLSIDVIAELFIQLLLDLTPAEDRSQAQRYGVEPVFDSHISSLPEWRRACDGGGESIPQLNRVVARPLGRLAMHARRGRNSRSRRPRRTRRRPPAVSEDRAALVRRAGRRPPEPLLVTQLFRSPIRPKAAQPFPKGSVTQYRPGSRLKRTTQD